MEIRSGQIDIRWINYVKKASYLFARPRCVWFPRGASVTVWRLLFILSAKGMHVRWADKKPARQGQCQGSFVIMKMPSFLTLLDLITPWNLKLKSPLWAEWLPLNGTGRLVCNQLPGTVFSQTALKVAHKRNMLWHSLKILGRVKPGTRFGRLTLILLCFSTIFSCGGLRPSKDSHHGSGAKNHPSYWEVARMIPASVVEKQWPRPAASNIRPGSVHVSS